MLNWIASLLPFGVLGFAALFVFNEGVPRSQGERAILVFYVVAAVVNLYFVFQAKAVDLFQGENIFSLWVRVKKAELKKRLD